MFYMINLLCINKSNMINLYNIVKSNIISYVDIWTLSRQNTVNSQ